jgi:hypothetical protein
VRLFEATPDHDVLPQRYLDPKRPTTRICAPAAEDGNLVFWAIVVVLRRRLAE